MTRSGRPCRWPRRAASRSSRARCPWPIAGPSMWPGLPAACKAGAVASMRTASCRKTHPHRHRPGRARAAHHSRRRRDPAARRRPRRRSSPASTCASPPSAASRTKRVVLDLPPGFAFASFEPVAGWRIRMSQRELVQPLQIDGPTSTTRSRGSRGRPRPRRTRSRPAASRTSASPCASRTASRVKADVQRAAGVRGRRDGALGRRPHEPDACAAGDARRRPRPRGGRDREGRRGCPPAKAAATGVPSQGLVIAALAAGGLGMLMGFTGWVVARSR